jgi:hypothetical protein
MLAGCQGDGGEGWWHAVRLVATRQALGSLPQLLSVLFLVFGDGVGVVCWRVYVACGACVCIVLSWQCQMVTHSSAHSD